MAAELGGETMVLGMNPAALIATLVVGIAVICAVVALVAVIVRKIMR